MDMRRGRCEVWIRYLSRRLLLEEKENKKKKKRRKTPDLERSMKVAITY